MQWARKLEEEWEREGRGGGCGKRLIGGAERDNQANGGVAQPLLINATI